MKEIELNALFTLLDDPDMEIFQVVRAQILQLGTSITPRLQEYQLTVANSLVKQRVDDILEELPFRAVAQQLQLWRDSTEQDLLTGLLIIDQLADNPLPAETVRVQLASMRQEIWRQLMYEMSPLEEVNLLNHVLFDQLRLRSNNLNFYDPNNSFISKVLTLKKGNPISLACIYSILAQQLDIPIYGINLPKHFILAYIQADVHAKDDILFYVNPFNRGQLMRKQEIQSFLRQLNLEEEQAFTNPCSQRVIIYRVLRNLATAYEHQEQLHKKSLLEEILLLMA